MKRKSTILLFGISLMFISFAIIDANVKNARAGDLTPIADPGASWFTLGDIFNRLDTNQAAIENNHDLTTASSPTGTFHTLKEIYEAIPTIVANTVKLGTSYLGIDGTLTPDGGTASAGDVFSGKTVHLTSDWDLDTGTLNLACNTSTFDGLSNLVNNDYDGDGDGTNRWCITDTGDAAAGDILSGKISWVDGQEITGTMANVGVQTITPTTSNQAITQGYHNGSGYCTGDADLISSNIKSGADIFGVAGDANVVDTSSGDADASKMLSGYKAWVDGSEITGNIISQTLSADSETVNAGYYDATTMSTVDANLASANIRSGITIFGISGDVNVVNTSSGDVAAGDIRSGKIGWADGSEITGTADIYAYGDDDASKVLTTASSAGGYDAANLSEDTVKKGTAFGVSSTGTFSGYPGTGWQPNGSGDGSTALSQANCESASNWEWFEDANGDGDTTDPEDGICVQTATVSSNSWNGALQVTPNNLADTTATSGTADSVTASGASWTADNYKNHIVKIISGTASGCWGRVKTNTSDTITVYGSWLDTAYASSCGTPDNTSHFQVFDDWGQYDNSFIGDYSCSGNFPNGTVSHGSYPSSGTMALAVADCYDGKRDLLPEETDRAVISGTATAASTTTITDSNLSLDTNVWIGQKVLIIGGTGANSYGFIESNTATQITVTDWLGGDDPAVGSEFSIIYIVPHASYVPDADIDGDDNDPKANNGSLTAEQLNNWQGTKLPSSSDFFGFCGYKDGGSNYESTSNASSADKTYGNYGGQIGRTDEFMDLANSGNWEWLSEQHYFNGARLAGTSACSHFNSTHVYNGYRFRGVFRP